ncbi:glycosyltransferase family 4 protein [Alteromonas sp. ASW11-130]|uniref:glycosyltransferase family 4 protein n=1 Tax=Alteromonas sp. ASW11-130 TaxID=3015775 RepID=UPI002241C868|nr:glycosyltransferase family 4 protein [Alteromonas sp. ASW11-130]MCW8091281.1 glycosyltransferase family 4 protein [Alteromonas sp. ASW11-130]
MNDYFKPFAPEQPNGVNVLTIAGAFPTPIQPWLVNHLVEIIRHGGDNRVISRRAELDQITEAVQMHRLTEKYICVPENRVSVLKTFLSAMSNQAVRKRTIALLSKYKGGNRSVVKRTFDVLAAPTLAVKPDIIHSHSEPVGTRLLPLIVANGAPFVQTFHGLTPIGVPTISADQRRVYSRAAKAVFVNTDFARKQFEAIGGESDNFIVVPQGIDLEKWRYSPCQYSDQGPINLLTVGRLDEEKGHIYAIQAIAELLRQGHQVHYHIVGRGPQGEYLKSKARDLGIQDRVTFHGVLIDDEIKEIYRKSHIFILPSLRSGDGLWEETQGVVLQEAQATGLHVIACDSGGISECLGDGKVGYLIPDRDVNAISGAVNDILSRKSEWSFRQQEARSWVEKHYSLSRIGEKMNTIYRHLIEDVQG